MKNTNRSPFIYPVYIVQVLNQLMEDSVKNRNGILSKRADIVEILYNQSNNFPITEQVYQMMWVWIIKMLNAGHYDWIKQYWYLQLIIPQYFISNKSGIWSLSLIVHSKG